MVKAGGGEFYSDRQLLDKDLNLSATLVNRFKREMDG